MSALSPECRTIQKNTSKIIDAITNQSDPNAFSLQLVENDFISSQSANGIVQTMGPSNFNKVSQLMQAVESQIRTASNTTATFQTFIIILRNLSLGTLADQLDQFYSKWSRLLLVYQLIMTLERLPMGSRMLQTTALLKVVSNTTPPNTLYTNWELMHIH